MTVAWHGVTVEFDVGWASTPATAIGSTTWTDESAYLRTIATQRGRSDELGTFQPGRASFVLDNRTRRFDPNYSSSPLFGNLLPMRRARLLLNTVAVWHGFIDDIPQAYDKSNKDATVTLNCTDGYAVLALLNLPESIYALEVATETPVAWWRLGETSGTIAGDSSGNNRTGTYVGGATTTGSLVPYSIDGAITFNAAQYVTVPPVVTGFPFTIEGWVQWTSGGTETVVLYQQTGVGNGVTVVGQTGGAIFVSLGTGGPTDFRLSTTTATTFGDGNPHHVVVTFANGTSAPTVYVDSVVQTCSNSGNGTSIVGTESASINFTGFAGTVDEVAIYNTALSAGIILDHYNAATAPWDGDLSGARVGKLLDLAAWPAADRTISTGDATLQPVLLGSQKALPVLQKVEQSEQGQMYMGADGTVVFRNRHWRYENTVAINSQATFGDDGSGVELPYWDIETDGGANFLRNRIIASRDGGAVVEAIDDASVAIYYERTDDELSGLQNSTDEDVLALVEWRVATRSAPIPRITVLELRPRVALAGYLTTILGLDIGERITVKRRPQGVGSAISHVMLIEGVGHQLDAAGNWTTRLYLSSFDSLTAVQPLIFDDATYGLFNTGVFAP